MGEIWSGRRVVVGLQGVAFICLLTADREGTIRIRKAFREANRPMGRGKAAYRGLGLVSRDSGGDDRGWATVSDKRHRVRLCVLDGIKFLSIGR